MSRFYVAAFLIPVACMGQSCGMTPDNLGDNGFDQVDTSEATARRALAGTWTWNGVLTQHGRMDLTITFDSEGKAISVRAVVEEGDRHQNSTYPDTVYTPDVSGPTEMFVFGGTPYTLFTSFHIENHSTYNFVEVDVVIGDTEQVSDPPAGTTYNLVDGLFDSNGSIRFTLNHNPDAAHWYRE